VRSEMNKNKGSGADGGESGVKDKVNTKPTQHYTYHLKQGRDGKWGLVVRVILLRNLSERLQATKCAIHCGGRQLGLGPLDAQGVRLVLRTWWPLKACEQTGRGMWGVGESTCECEDM